VDFLPQVLPPQQPEPLDHCGLLLRTPSIASGL